MYANLGPGMEADIDPPSPDGVDMIHGDDYIMRRMRANPNLYGYVRDNPVNLLDPSGLMEICGPYVWLYTGWWCIDERIHEAALQSAADYILCWWDCEVTIHKCVTTYAADVAGAAEVIRFTHLEIGKTAFRGGLEGASRATTLQSQIAYELYRKGYKGVAQKILRRGA